MRRGGRVPRIALGAVAAALAHPSVSAAQVPVTSLGLGYPVPALDARSAALGGSGIGLIGGSFSLLNPADITAHAVPALHVTLAPEGIDVKRPGGSDPSGRSRFAVLSTIVPLGEWAFAGGFSSDLDQDWSARFTDTLDTSFGRFPFEEVRENDGGTSSVNLALARKIGRLSVGGGYGRVTGSLRQLVSRRFDPEAGSSIVTLAPFREDTRWTYSSWRLSGGAALSFGERFRASGVVEWSSDLTAEEDSTGVTRRFGMPLTVRFGGSALLSPRFLVTGTGGWAQWSRAVRGLQGVRAQNITWGGVGVEYRGFGLGALDLPLRAGGRFTELPFFPRGRKQLRETAVTFGLGGTVSGGRGAFDLGFEIGTRGELARTGAEESFRRFSISITLRQ
ncbi:MAG: hypothetical protein ACE5HF_02130 [Gemmatimonadota bacterium]